MKIVILGDLHLGARGNSEVMSAHFKEFFDFMFGYMNDNGIDTIFQLGDMFDSRRNISFKTLATAHDDFFLPLSLNKFKLYSVLGNHDIFYRESLSVASSDLLLRQYDNVQIIKEPMTKTFGGIDFDFIPWICKENSEEVMSFITKSQSPYALGHFEIMMWEMYKGSFSQVGIEVDSLSKYKEVFSGHYHTASSRYNVNYLGTPYQITFQDVFEKKGFYVFDTETETLTFVENPKKIFHAVVYDDTKKKAPKIKNKADLKNTYIRVYLKAKTEEFLYQNFINELFSCEPEDVKIVNQAEVGVLTESAEGDEEDLRDTVSVMVHHIQSMDMEKDKRDKLQNFMLDLYREAQSKREFVA